MSARPWLPKEAFRTVESKAVLAEPVAQWSERWFVRMPATITKLREDVRGLSPAHGTEIHGPHASLEIPGTGKRHLLEAMLDASLAEQTRSDGDNQVLDALMTEAGQDLVQRLGNVLSPSGEDDDALSLRYTVSIGRNEVLDIVVSASAVIPLLKPRFKAHRLAARPLGQRRTALRNTRLTARAVLGQAELSLGDVKGLAVGDVLVLDRSLNERIELYLPGHDRPVMRGHLRRSGSQISIQL